MEFTNEMKSTIVHFAIGALMGFVSFKLGRNLGLAIGVVLAFALSKLSAMMFNKHEKKWWMGNGLWPYLTAWIASWTVFLNA